MSTSRKDASGKDTSEELHSFVCEVARKAGELQLSRNERPGEITEKVPKDLVTEVDYLCENLMIEAIRERYPDDAILSEEMGGSISESGRSWLLDPVDGTANYARGNPIFCACVSVVEDGEVTHAAVAVPRMDDLYHAKLDGGAYRDSNGASTPLRVGGAEKIGDAFIGADLSFVGSKAQPYGPRMREILFNAWQLRALGSAGVRGAWLAAGFIDASIGTRNTVWDYAPTALMVAEAGGRAVDLSGNPWQLDSDGLIAANDTLLADILNIIHSD